MLLTLLQMGQGLTVNLMRLISFGQRKANRSIWGLAFFFENKLYVTRDLVDAEHVPEDIKLLEPAPQLGLCLRTGTPYGGWAPLVLVGLTVGGRGGGVTTFQDAS